MEKKRKRLDLHFPVFGKIDGKFLGKSLKLIPHENPKKFLESQTDKLDKNRETSSLATFSGTRNSF